VAVGRRSVVGILSCPNTTVSIVIQLSRNRVPVIAFLRRLRRCVYRKRNVTVWRPFVCPVGIHTVTHQGAACDAASVHFGPTIRRTDILIYIYNNPLLSIFVCFQALTSFGSAIRQSGSTQPCSNEPAIRTSIVLRFCAKAIQHGLYSRRTVIRA